MPDFFLLWIFSFWRPAGEGKTGEASAEIVETSYRKEDVAGNREGV